MNKTIDDTIPEELSIEEETKNEETKDEETKDEETKDEETNGPFSFLNNFSKQLNTEFKQLNRDAKEYFNHGNTVLSNTVPTNTVPTNNEKTVNIFQEINLKKDMNDLYLKYKKQNFNFYDIIDSINNDLTIMLELNNVNDKNEMRKYIEHYLLEILVKKKTEPNEEGNISITNTTNKFDNFKPEEDKTETRKIKATVLPSLTDNYFHSMDEDKKDKLKQLSYNVNNSIFLKKDNQDMSWDKFISSSIDEIRNIPTNSTSTNSQPNRVEDEILKLIQTKKGGPITLQVKNDTTNNDVVENNTTDKPDESLFTPFYITKLNTSINNEIERFRDQYEEMSYFMDSSFYLKTFDKEPDLNFLEIKETSKLAYEYKMFKYKCINNAIHFLKNDPKFEYNEKTETIDYKEGAIPEEIDAENLIENFKQTSHYFWTEKNINFIHTSNLNFTKDFYKMFENVSESKSEFESVPAPVP